MAESRIQNTNRNILTNLLNRVVMLLLPFVVRTAVIYTFGVEYLGLNSLFAAILNMLSLAELGVGSAMVFSMYKPIAENNVAEVSALLNLYRKVYRIIGSFILIVGLSLIPFLDHLIKGTPPEGMNIRILYVIFLSGTVLSYFLYAYKGSILTAAQKSYITGNIGIVLAIIQEFTKLAVILILKDFYIYCLVSLPFIVTSNLITNYVVNKKYPQYKCYGTLDKETLTDIKKRVTGLFLYKICFVFRDMFGSIVISAFIGLAVLGQYNNYQFIYSTIAGLLLLLRNSMQASIGNSIAIESESKNHSDFLRFQCMYVFLATWCCICMLALYQPFITVWIGKDYLLDNKTMASFCILLFWGTNCDMCMTYRQAAGLWWQDRFRPIVEAVTNVVLCVLLIKPLGVLGVTLSSLFCKFFINSVWASWVLYRYYFKSYKQTSYLKRLLYYLAIFIVTATAVWFICKLLPFEGVYQLVCNALVCIIVAPLIMLPLFRILPESKTALPFIKNVLRIGIGIKKK